MIVTIKINTANDAFTGDKKREVAKCITAVVERYLKKGDTSGKVMDVNGNSVGTFSFEGQ